MVLNAYAAYASGDIDGAIAGLHPDVEWIEPDEFPSGGRRQGGPQLPSTCAGPGKCGRNLSRKHLPSGGATTS